MAYDAGRGQVVLFGGESSGGLLGLLNDTWTWDGSSWIPKCTTTCGLPSRAFHAMTYDAARGQVVLFGGVGNAGTLLNDTWVWDGSAWTAKSPSSSPPRRSGHGLAYDAALGQVVLFGGYGQLSPTVIDLNDTWIWDGAAWRQKVFPTATDVPPARHLHVMAYDAARGQVVLFGGLGFNDTWLWGEEFRIFPIGSAEAGTGVGSEPSIAVDPLHPLHAVVGFNDASGILPTCGWAETTDGGATWTAGALPLPQNYQSCADPWVRFGPDGTLFYSGVGAKPEAHASFTISSKTIAVLVAVSNGLARDLQIATVVASVKQICGITDILSNRLKCPNLPFTDHPSITVIRKNPGFRAVVAWATFPKGQEQPSIEASSYDGFSWSPRITLGHGTGPIVGGDQSRAAVTWFDNGSGIGTLMFRISNDGQNWDPVTHTLAITDPLFGTSTTDKVLAGPYAIVIPGQMGLRAIWQVRTVTSSGEISQVFLGDLVDNSPANSLGNANTESFLPGAGACVGLAGAYQVTSDAGLFRYTVWFLGLQAQQLIFTSGASLDGHNGFPKQGFPGTINDYTGADCSTDFGWAAWTDLRDGIPGKPEIWGAKVPLR